MGKSDAIDLSIRPGVEINALVATISVVGLVCRSLSPAVSWKEILVQKHAVHENKNRVIGNLLVRSKKGD